MDKEFYESIENLLKLERKSLTQNTELLKSLMSRGIQDVDKLDRVADQILDVMHGLSGEGEDFYRQYLDYIATFNPTEAKKRRNDLEYDLGYKTHVLYAAALLCKKELESKVTPDGRTSFQVVMDDYIPKVYDVLKKTASFLFFAHYANNKTVTELMPMLQAITEETDYVYEHVDEFEELMHYPNNTYHPLTEEEWQTIQYIAEHNIQLYEQHPEVNKDLMERIFGN
jgi:hypothetical protein